MKSFQSPDFGKFIVGALQVNHLGVTNEVILWHEDRTFEEVLINVDVELGFEGVVISDDRAVDVGFDGGDSRNILNVLGSISANV